MYRKLISIGEGYVMELLNANNPHSRILRCQFNNKMSQGTTMNTCQKLNFELDVVPHKEGNKIGAVKVFYLLGKLFMIFDTFNQNLSIRNIEFVVRDVKNGKIIKHFMSACQDENDLSTLEFDFYLSQ